MPRRRSSPPTRTVQHIVAFAVLVLLIAAVYETGLRIPHLAPHLPAEIGELPYYAGCSFYRMLAAYILSFFFAVFYGSVAAADRRAERVMMPLLDFLQSVPVLGFFPAAIAFFISATHGSRLGVELACIFLIFTGQAWNMAFGVYESLTTIPGDSVEAADSFGVSGWLRFKRFLFPVTIPKLVYNSILSWAGGWYFLIACEIIASGPVNYKLPGLGSFLVQSADEGKIGHTLIGIGALVFVIVSMDIFLWRPLSVWATKFRYEFTISAAEIEESAILRWWKTSRRARKFRRSVRRFRRSLPSVGFPMQRLRRAVARPTRWIERTRSPMRGRVVLVVLATAAAIILYRGGASLVRILSQPWPDEARLIPKAIALSALRLLAAYVVALAWTLPLAAWASRRPVVARNVNRFAQIAASIPATALFPLIVLFVIRFIGSVNVAAILLILTGMQWYLLFNLLAGVRNIPNDLMEASASLRLSRLQYWRKVLLPAVFPSLVTGSVTAWGGGWNALIVSEYLVYQNQTFQVLGIGMLLDRATYVTGSNVMILLTLSSMVLVIAAINRLVWRPLYAVAAERFKIEY